MIKKIKEHFKNNWMLYGYSICILINVPTVISGGFCTHHFAWLAIGLNVGCLLWHKFYFSATRWRDEALDRNWSRIAELHKKNADNFRIQLDLEVENTTLKTEIQKLKDGK